MLSSYAAKTDDADGEAFWWVHRSGRREKSIGTYVRISSFVGDTHCSDMCEVIPQQSTTTPFLTLFYGIRSHMIGTMPMAVNSIWVCRGHKSLSITQEMLARRRPNVSS